MLAAALVLNFKDPASVYGFSMMYVHHQVMWFMFIILAVVYWSFYKIIKEYNWYSLNRQRGLFYVLNNTLVTNSNQRGLARNFFLMESKVWKFIWRMLYFYMFLLWYIYYNLAVFGIMKRWVNFENDLFNYRKFENFKEFLKFNGLEFESADLEGSAIIDSMLLSKYNYYNLGEKPTNAYIYSLTS